MSDGPKAAGFGLRPRPAVDPVVVALVAAAALEIWSGAAAAAAQDAQAACEPRADQAERLWRLSGRWWARPSMQRRERPSGRTWAR